MTQSPETRPGIPKFSRRLFNKGLIVAPGAVAAGLTIACAERASDNSAVIADLKNKLEVTPATTRQSFTQRSSELALSNPFWQANSKFEFTTDLKKKVTVNIGHNGQPYVNLTAKDEVQVDYVDPRSTGLKHSVEIVSGQNDRHFAVYGTANTVALFKDRKSDINKFLQEYFGDSKALSVLHLVFLPSQPSIDLLDIGNKGNKMKSISTRATTGLLTDDKSILRFDVVINIPYFHKKTIEESMSLETSLTMVLANEMANLLVDQATPFEKLQTEIPEGISTLSGYLAGLDKDFARMILGGTAYEPFVKIVADEMRRIGKVKKAA